jgi:FG-GAP-like repeat
VERPRQEAPERLYLNLLETKPLTFEDKSVERLGYAESHARDAIAADVDADGFVDVLFVNGFNTAPPFLHMNRGAEKPGYFRLESDRRGLSETLSSASADFGDIDNDGDLDLVISDTGPDWAKPPGGAPRLYRNDGKGFFVADTAHFPAGIKTTHMGVNLADLDGDFDLDFFGSNKPEEYGFGHYLMWNDGKGAFHDAAEGTMGPTTGAVYEADNADLDGDGDEDLFFTSLAKVEVAGTRNRFPFGEGPMRNTLKESGAAKFETLTALGQDDDNDLVFLDHDQDGDLDVVIASLGPREKLMRNLGGLAFEITDGVVEVVRDPSLDIAVGDIDNDGDDDLVTANGLERIGSKQPPCGLYVNDGAKDTRAPLLQAIEPLADPSPAAGPFVLRVRARDDSLDDGRTWLTLAGSYCFDDGAPADAKVTFQGGSQWRCEIPGPAPAGAKSLSVTITATDRSGNTTTSEPRRVMLANR